MKKIILLTGIHGVGKGYISERIRCQVNFPIYEASRLIKQSGNISDFNKLDKMRKNNIEILEKLQKIQQEGKEKLLEILEN